MSATDDIRFADSGIGGQPVAADANAHAVQLAGLTHLATLARTGAGVALIARVGAWRDALRNGDPRAIVVETADDLRVVNEAARALLKVTGELSGEPVVVAGRELFVGDVVEIRPSDKQLLDCDGRELPPVGVLGTVIATDVADGVFEVDFTIAGSHRIAVASDAAAALDYGYAEQASFVGAPLIDLRTLPDFDPALLVAVAAVPELSW